MPVQGISSGQAAFSQAQFDQVKRDINLNGKGLDVPRKAEGGAGDGAVWTNTVQSQRSLERQAAAHGYNAVRLAPTQFESRYNGSLLNRDFHLLNPGYSFVKVDFHA